MAVYTAVRPRTGRVKPCRRPCTCRVQGRGPCTRLVRSVLLRFSLQKTHFIPKRTAINALHSKRARTTSAPNVALRRTTVLRTMLIIGWMESWATCLFSTNYDTKVILTYNVVQTESDAEEYLSVMREKKQFSLPLYSPICIYMLKYSLFGNFKRFILILTMKTYV